VIQASVIINRSARGKRRVRAAGRGVGASRRRLEGFGLGRWASASVEASAIMVVGSCLGPSGFKVGGYRR
jgi:hypothetical protein